MTATGSGIENMPSLPKCPTGVKGLDEITGGGLPVGRPTLVCGGPGCGKTLFGMEFLVRGILQYDQAGVFVSFEESADELASNYASLGVDLHALVAAKRLLLDYVHMERSEMEEVGDYDLEGLFIRIGHAIDSIGAKRVVLDSVEALFPALTNDFVLRSELRRLFQYLKTKGVTTIVTGEQGAQTLTRYGLEEYVADCVISLNHRVSDQIATRRLRIMKYRGSCHGTNEYPFLIDEQGISVLPITSLGLQHPASTERISSGIPRLDTMLGGEGFFRGSSILVTGSAGTGKSSLAAHFVDAACRRGERAIYFAFEESQNQIIRNMRSIGIDLEKWVQAGLLTFRNSRPTLFGLEMHLVTMHNLVESFAPTVVVIDPISNLVTSSSAMEVRAMLSRLIDYLKTKQVTAVCTDLTCGGAALEGTEVGISSLMDAWILLRNIEANGERNRGIFILKARGMKHSNQVREFILTDQGIQLRDVYVGASGVLTGAARTAQEAKEAAEMLARRQDMDRKQRQLERRKATVEAQIASLRREFESEQEELLHNIEQSRLKEEQVVMESEAMALTRNADVLLAGALRRADAVKGGVEQ